MHLIMYTSEYTGDYRSMPDDFTNILNSARTHNPEHGITGILFYDQGKFIQIIEGEQSQLNNLMTTMTQDKRHTNMQVLINHPIKQRELNNWNMEAFDISHHIEKDWSLLVEFRDAYLQNYKISANQLISWLRHFVVDHDKVKRMNDKH